MDDVRAAAFPFQVVWDGVERHIEAGLTKRELFAMVFEAALLSGAVWDLAQVRGETGIEAMAIRRADALLSALSTPGP